MNSYAKIVLETNRLLLREWQLQDAAAALQIYGDPEVMSWLGQQPHSSTADTQAMIQKIIARSAKDKLGMWAIIEKNSGKLIGQGGLKFLANGPEIEVGYHLGRSHWGKGYATEVAVASVHHGFEQLGLQRIVGVTTPDNLASQRVLEKAGLQYQGMRYYYNHYLRYYTITKAP